MTDSENLKLVKLAKYKENLIAIVSGNEICAKLKIFNYKTNQVSLINIFNSISFCIFNFLKDNLSKEGY